MESTVLTIILPILGAGIGYFIKHLIEKRKELLSEVCKERRELYQRFIDIIIEMLKRLKKDVNDDLTNLKSELFDSQKKYMLYASPKVINRFSDYFQYIYSTKENTNNIDKKMHFSKLSSIIIAMRKDLGLKNTGLGKDGLKIMRASFPDFDKTMR